RRLSRPTAPAAPVGTAAPPLRGRYRAPHPHAVDDDAFHARVPLTTRGQSLSEHSITRLLDLITRELGALEARVEFGGTPPDEPISLWASLPGGWRIVTRFEKAPDDAKQLSLKLRQLAASFFEVPPEPPRLYSEGYTNWTT